MLTSFEDACRQLGIPSDRAGLVKRNVELRGKLKLALAALQAFQEAQHLGFKHLDALDVCSHPICVNMQIVIAQLKDG